MALQTQGPPSGRGATERGPLPRGGKKAPRTPHAIREQRAGHSFITPSLLVMLALIIYPLGYGLYISFFRTNLRNQWDFVGLKFYTQTLSDPDFIRSIGVTLLFAVLVVLGNLVVGTVLA